jgi:pyruvate, water dikinase
MTKGPVDQIVETLRERAKELHCLYNVHEVVNRPGASQDEVCRALVEAIPPGWQYPTVCWARITLDHAIYEPPRAVPTPWVQRADIVVAAEAVGAVEVFYTRQMPKADEGPFLKEERRLVNTIAETLGHYVMHRRLQSAASSWQAANESLPTTERAGWWVIIEFLRKTDHQLLSRISRRMINYLCWNGIPDAMALLERFASNVREDSLDENRPLERKSLEYLLALTDDAFRIAAENLSEPEIVTCIEKWIKDDKSGFLIKAVENTGTSLTEITDALARYEQTAITDHDLSRAVQIGLRVSLARRFFADDLDFVNAAKQYLDVRDFHELSGRVIAPPSSHGKLGGKAAGLFLAAQIVRKSTEYADALSGLKIPRTWYLTSDALLDFVEHNHLEDLYNRKYLEIDQIRREYPHIVHIFKNSTFSAEIARGLASALDEFDERPLIVRSSSLLEDRPGAAFSGKYKSLFLANLGTKGERLAALMDAIAEVYASIFSPDPIEYRAERGLLDLHEEMGVMIQEVVGTRVGHYYLPAFAGVAFSTNEFRWSARITRRDGLLRLVPGLGTRAVDRVSDDYPILIAPGQPGLRVNVTTDEIVRYSPSKVDLIDLDTRRFETVELDALLREVGWEFPAIQLIVSKLDEDGVRGPVGFGWDPAHEHCVVTFEGLIERTPFISQMRALLRLLEERLGTPVDLEFASDGKDFYLLQCRAQSSGDAAAPTPIPRDVPPERVIFSANRYVSNGSVRDITHIVYVDPESYRQLPDVSSLREVGRVIGRLNSLLPKRQFVLMGPGRWGSRGDITLGVNVTYSDVNNTAMLIEMAARHGSYVPELSFGTHFFQDLVESSIRYLPLFPGDPHVAFNERFLRESPSILGDLLPDYAWLSDVVRVIDVPRTSDGQVLRILLNADLDEAVGMLAAPAGPVMGVASEPRRELSQAVDEHWRWRLRMAERIAAEIDAPRFGVLALYVFGSTKNATAGPASDIDLIVHLRGTPDQRAAMETWLDGWSRCLSEMNYLRTGARTNGLLDVHIITDEDIAARSSYAVKVGAVTDPARLLARYQ